MSVCAACACVCVCVYVCVCCIHNQSERDHTHHSIRSKDQLKHDNYSDDDWPTVGEPKAVEHILIIYEKPEQEERDEVIDLQK